MSRQDSPPEYPADATSLCVACRSEVASRGALCEGCANEIAAEVGLVPEQVVATATRPTPDALIDQWGRAHFLDERTLLGRAVDSVGIVLREASVSRHHAHLVRIAEGWRLRDLASINGTFVNDEPIDSIVLAHGDRITIGVFNLFVAIAPEAVPVALVDPALIHTKRSVRHDLDDFADGTELTAEEARNSGLTDVRFRVSEAASGSGGLLEVNGVSIHLSTSQVRLVALLAQRMVAEEHQPSFVRGFVRNSELLACLQWDTSDPNESHVKQLVRRTRRQFVRAGVGDLIEARQRFGYRLRIIPRE